MAITLTELETMRDALIRARSSGELRVTHGERTTVYRSIDEINAAISQLEDDIAEASGVAKAPLVRRYVTRSGW